MPEMVWTLTTRFSAIAGESAPRTRRAAAEVNSGRPVIGRYSWSRDGSFSRTSVAWYRSQIITAVKGSCELTFFTTGNTQGLESSSL